MVAIARIHNDVNEISDIGQGGGQDAWHEPVYDVWDDIEDAGTGNGNMTFIPKPGGEWIGLGSGLHRVVQYLARIRSAPDPAGFLPVGPRE
ncbi:MAG TPA: hypothetical protein ENH78_02120 [Phycisphaerae bacterium]|nr:hypothetical protein [Phycisphaerae bacterium]